MLEMDASQCRAPPFRLTNVTQTDILPFLPFPAVPTGQQDAAITASINETELAKDWMLVRQLHGLLHSTDVSHL